jgi:DNA helicase IV
MVARSKAVREFVDTVWPPLNAVELLARLYTDELFLRRCSAGILTERERAMLRWPQPPRSVKTASWTAADAVLIDELIGMLDGTASYVHAVVDEAQDLSPMQCRAVGRRCPLGSVTVLGDLAQATTPWAPGAWPDTLRHLGHRSAQVRPLTVGYRVPAEVLQLANRLLPHVASDVPAATSIRGSGDTLRFVPGRDLISAVRDIAVIDGSVGVIVPDAARARVLTILTRAGVPAEPLDLNDDPKITVVPASQAKGLEFDSVVLVEPAQIVAGEATRAVGLRRLYVTLTRAVSRLAVVHDQPLPAELAS